MILVGRKATMHYVLGAMTQINNGAETIEFKARGNAITRMVNAVNVITNIMFPDWDIEDIQMRYEHIEGNTFTTNLSIVISA